MWWGWQWWNWRTLTGDWVGYWADGIFVRSVLNLVGGVIAFLSWDLYGLVLLLFCFPSSYWHHSKSPRASLVLNWIKSAGNPLYQHRQSGLPHPSERPTLLASHWVLALLAAFFLPSAQCTTTSFTFGLATHENNSYTGYTVLPPECLEAAIF